MLQVLWERQLPHQALWDSLLLVFLLTAGLGAWLAYDRQAALAKFWLLAGAFLLFYVLASQRAHNLWPITHYLSAANAVVAVYFLLSHDWIEAPAEVIVIDRIAQNWMALRPSWGLPMIHPNRIAGIVAMLAPFTVATGIQAWRQRRIPHLWGTVATGLLVSGGLLLTASRGAWFALACALGMWLLWPSSGWLARATRLPRPPVYLLALLTLGTLVLGVLSFFRVSPLALATSLPGAATAASRVMLYQNTLDLITDFPFTGGGLAAFPGLYSQYILGIPSPFFFYSHNLFLDVALEQGPLGLLALVAIFLLSSWCLWTSSRHLTGGPGEQGAGDLDVLRWATLAGLLVVLLHGFADDALYGSRGTPLLWIVPGVALAISAASSEKQPKRQQRLKWVGPAPALLVLGTAIGVTLYQPWRAAWYANLGAIQMARVELAHWPTNRWDDGSNVAALSSAEASFNQALAANPANGTAHHRLGLIAWLRRDFTTAADHLEAAYQVDKDHRGIRKALGYAYVWTGRYDEALALLVYVPESSRELESYAHWWRTQDRDDLSAQARQMRQQLDAAILTRKNQDQH